MENHDKIYEQFKNAAQKAEAKEFPAIENVWSRVESKLDKKEDKKVIALWKKLAVAASLLLFLSLGYQFFKMSSVVVTPSAKPENNVVIKEKLKDTLSVPKPQNAIVTVEPKKTIIKKEAGRILDKQLSTDNVAIVDPYEYDDIKKDKLEDLAPAAKEMLVFEDKAIVESEKAYSSQAEKTITGILSDETGPLPGANVVVQGTKNGTQTDINGKYSIVAKQGDTLEFSYVGMKDAMASVGKSNELNARLLESGAKLDEVVVTAYGVKRRTKDLSYATKTVDAKELKIPVEELFTEQELEDFLNQNLEKKVEIKDKFLILNMPQIPNLDGVILNTEIHIDLKKLIFYTIRSINGLTTLQMHLKEPNSGIIKMQFSFKNPDKHLLDVGIKTMKSYQIK